MPRGEMVPITPAVLRWAIDESGYSSAEISKQLGVDPRLWLTGKAQPTVTQLRKLAEFLKRPFTTFLLPAPPATPSREIQFRAPPGRTRKHLDPDERKFVRDASRQQKVLGWLVGELGGYPERMPTSEIDREPEQVAVELRSWLGVSFEQQAHWKTPATAFREWRTTLEAKGVFVFMLAMGADACRAFSLSDAAAPVVAVNSAWNYEARTFSLMHELGHLVTGTESACLEGSNSSVMSSTGDPAERWCERFAAALLLPKDHMAEARRLAQVGPGKVTTLDAAVALAGVFRVSLRATILRLIELHEADWVLYRKIPKAADTKSGFGRSKEKRTRDVVRRDEYGRRTISIYLNAMKSDVIDRSAVTSYLNVTDDEVDRIQVAMLSSANSP